MTNVIAILPSSRHCHAVAICLDFVEAYNRDVSKMNEQDKLYLAYAKKWFRWQV